jgi:hypothetical protein
MKNLTYLIALMFSLVLISTSCSKENSLTPESVPDKPGNTAINLVGNWDFVSLEYQGRTITGYDAEFQKTLDYVTIGFRDATTTTLKLYSNCSLWLNQGEESVSVSYDYTLNKTELNINNGWFKFDILSATPTTLKLKLSDGGTTVLPIGGIYTLQKK